MLRKWSSLDANALLFALIALHVPDAFSYESPPPIEGDQDEAIVAFLYFSFVTLSTLGYGDIVPQVPEVAALAYTEALIGQIYLVVMVARLVSLHSAKR